MSNYQAVYNCRKTRGGGTILYIRNDIMYDVLDIPEIDRTNVCGIFLKNYNINIFNIYRSPKNKINKFFSYFSEILVEYSNSIIVGDINVDVLKQSNKTKEYKDMLQLNSFKIQNIHRGCIITRRSKNKGTIIDHLITQNNKKCKIKPYDIAITDHKMLKITVHQKTNNGRVREIKEVQKTNHSKFLSCIQKIDFNNIQNLNQLVTAISEAKKDSTNTRQMKILNNNEWFNYTVQKQIKKRDKAYKKMVKHPDEEIYRENFKNIKNETNYLIRQTKKDYVNNQILKAGTNVKQIWKVINTALHLKKKEGTNIQKLKVDQSIITTKECIANYMNEYFADIASKLHGNIDQHEFNTFEEIHGNKCIYLKKCTEKELSQVIATMKSTTSTGDDLISMHDIKQIYHLIKDKLIILINECLKTGSFPSALKITKLIPIFKKGSRYEVGNYRPIALTSTVAKILEKIIKKRFVEFFELSDRQYGFQASSSTLGAAGDLVENIVEKTDQGYIVATVFVDLQKAFDTVEHQLLLVKLHHLGVQGPALRLIREFLVDRRQYVRVGKTSSNRRTVTCGIPQGSVLGPLLYLLYVESLSKAGLSAGYYMFADDTVLMFYSESVDHLQHEINVGLEVFHGWLCKNRLVVSKEKTVYMLFKPRSREKDIKDISVKINNKLINKVQHYTYLGLTIDDKLNWGGHVDSVFNKLGGLISCVRHVSNLFDEKSKLMFYNAHINSVLSYLIAIWGNTTQFNINRLQRLQNRAIKNIFNLPYETSSASLYKRFPILPIRKLIKYELCTLVYKIDHKLLKSNIEFKRNITHSYETRDRDRYTLDKHVRTEFGRRRPSYIGAALYNELPRDLRLSQSCKVFKRSLKMMLLQTE